MSTMTLLKILMKKNIWEKILSCKADTCMFSVLYLLKYFLDNTYNKRPKFRIIERKKANSGFFVLICHSWSNLDLKINKRNIKLFSCFFFSNSNNKMSKDWKTAVGVTAGVVGVAGMFCNYKLSLNCHNMFGIFSSWWCVCISFAQGRWIRI